MKISQFQKQLSIAQQLCLIHIPKTAGSTLIDNAKKVLESENLLITYSARGKQKI